MIDPDVGGFLDSDGIAIIGFNLANLHVAHDNILLAQDRQTDTGECC